MRTLDWRNASWLAPLDSVTEDLRLQHEAALKTLEQYERDGRPFALFLRCYRFRQLYSEVVDDYGALEFEDLLWEHFKTRGIGLILVRSHDFVFDRATAALSVLLGRKRPPSLMLHDDSWLDAAREMMARAELIIAECQFLTPGLVLELKACQETRRVDRTVLVLPSPPIESIDDREEIAPFPRAIHNDEIDWKAPFDHIIFADLIARLESIAGLSANERLAVTRGEELDSKFPISFPTFDFEMLAQDHWKAGRKTRVAFYYSRLAQFARRSDDERFTAMYLSDLANARFAIGDFKGGLDSVLEAESRLKRVEKGLPENAVLSSAKMRQWKKDIVMNPAQSFLAQNQTKETFEFLTEILIPIRKWRDKAAEALALSKWAEAEIRAGSGQDALETISRVTELARESDDVFREAFGIYLRGAAYQALKDERRAAESYHEALKKLPRPNVYEVDWAIFNVYEVDWAIFMNLGGIAEQRGLEDSAVDLYAAAEAAAGGLKDSGREDAAREARKRIEAGRQREQP